MTGLKLVTRGYYSKGIFAYFISLFFIIACIVFLFCNRNALASNDRFLGTSPAFAQVEYINPVNIQVSARGVNHISFAPLIISTITGDVSEYSASVSENGSEIFLTSKLEAGNIIPLAVTIAGGRVIDLKLEVVESLLPKVVKINLHKTQDMSKLVQNEIIKMINAMRMGEVGKYYVIENSKKAYRGNTRNIKIGNSSLAITELNTYKFDDLTGIELDMKNINKAELVVSAYILSKSFKDVIAVVIDDKKLEQGASTKGYIVLKHRLSI